MIFVDGLICYWRRKALRLPRMTPSRRELSAVSFGELRDFVTGRSSSAQEFCDVHDEQCRYADA